MPIHADAAKCFPVTGSPASVRPGHRTRDNVSPGGRFEVLPPAGMFTPADLYTDFLLWVGGSGITPVMSVLKSALCAGLILACQARPTTDEVRIQF
jgi:ferredoxin-NADP reductase